MKSNKLFISLIIAGMSIMSYIMANQKTTSVTNYSLSNIEALNASAAEFHCDNSSNQDCVLDAIEVGGPIGYGKGRGHLSFN